MCKTISRVLEKSSEKIKHGKMKTKKKIIDVSKSQRKINADEIAKFLRAEKIDIKIEEKNKIKNKGDKK